MPNKLTLFVHWCMLRKLQCRDIQIQCSCWRQCRDCVRVPMTTICNPYSCHTICGMFLHLWPYGNWPNIPEDNVSKLDPWINWEATQTNLALAVDVAPEPLRNINVMIIIISKLDIDVAKIFLLILHFVLNGGKVLTLWGLAAAKVAIRRIQQNTSTTFMVAQERVTKLNSKSYENKMHSH